MSQEPQTPQEEALGQTFDAGSEDEAVNALSKRNAEADESPETPEDEPKDEADAEPGDGETDEAEPEEELVEVKSKNGKTYMVPREIEEDRLRQAEFSRKMNATAEKEKAYQQRLESLDGLHEVADKRADALAEVKTLDKQIKAYEGVDWAKAKAENPGHAAMAAIELLSLKDARKDAVNAAAQLARELTEGRNRLKGEQAADMGKALDKSLPGWRGDVGVRITAYAVEQGWKPEELSSITDPRIVLALDAASKYAALQKSKGDLKAKAASAPPVSKPGARRQANPATDAMARFGKSRSDEDAIAALQSRFKR